MKIGYARVSTRLQNPDRQQDALEEAGCERIFLDVVSGGASKLPKREKALAQLRKGDTFVVLRLARLGRSQKDLHEIVDRINDMGAEFVSLNEGFDTTKPGGKLMFGVFAALYEFNRELIRERTNEGLKAASERGNTGGRPRALDKHETRVAAEMMKDSGVKTADICERFEISRSTLYTYVGPEGEIRK